MQITKPVHQWQLSFESEWPTSVTFLGSSQRLAAGNRSGEIFLWELPVEPPAPTADEKKSKDTTPPDFAPTRQLLGHTNGISHLRTTPAGNMLISSSLDHTIRLWDVNAAPTGKARVILDQKAREQRARYKPKAEKEQILNAPGIEVGTVSESQVLNEHEGWINGLGISGDGKRIITGDDRCKTVVWDLASRKPVAHWFGSDRVWVRSCALSPDGKTAFTCEFAGRRSSFDCPAAQVRLWDVETGTAKLDLLKVWTPEVKEKDRGDTYGYMQTWSKLIKRGLVCAAFSPNGKLLAVGQGGETDTGKIHLVDTESGKILRTVSGHRYGACDVTFSADGKYVLSVGRDTMLRICQVSDGKEVAALGKSRGGQFKDWLHAVAVSPDQKTVAAADIAGLVHVWQL